MKNKKRIGKLINRKYKPEKQYPKIPWHFSNILFSDPEDIFISDFGVRLELEGIEAEKASNKFLSYYNSIPKALVDPEQTLFNMLPLNNENDHRGIDNWLLNSGRSYGKNQSLVDYVLQKNLEEISKKNSDYLSEYIRMNLEYLGFFFEDENEFLDFAKNRITRISFSEDMYHFEYYLDYVSETNRGILIGISNGKVKWTYEPNKITVTIG